ncbi:hypothetical protein LCGC14_3045950, partial [marine sediment metagenome]
SITRSQTIADNKIGGGTFAIYYLGLFYSFIPAPPQYTTQIQQEWSGPWLPFHSLVAHVVNLTSRVMTFTYGRSHKVSDGKPSSCK